MRRSFTINIQQEVYDKYKDACDKEGYSMSKRLTILMLRDLDILENQSKQ